MIVTVSTKGEFVIPKALRLAMGLSAGTPLEIEATPRGPLLRPVTRKGSITMAEFLEMPLPYEGPPLTDAEIAAALDTNALVMLVTRDDPERTVTSSEATSGVKVGTESTAA